MWLFSGECKSLANLAGKTAVITGSSDGIGKETLLDFYKRGAKIIMACRNVEKAHATAREIEKNCQNSMNRGKILITKLNLASIKSVRRCARYLLKNEEYVHILINNGGVLSQKNEPTEDNFEVHFGTNYLGHFLLTLLLLPKIIESKPSRIVNVSSTIHGLKPLDLDDLNWTKKSYNSFVAYQQSKLALVLFTKELARKLEEANVSGVSVYAVHPGIVDTQMVHKFNPFSIFDWLLYFLAKILFKTPKQGAQTVIYCAVDEKTANETGLYYSDCKIAKPSIHAEDTKTSDILWDVSLKLVGLQGILWVDTKKMCSKQTY